MYSIIFIMAAMACFCFAVCLFYGAFVAILYVIYRASGGRKGFGAWRAACGY